MTPLQRVLASYACAAVATGLPWPLLLVLTWEQYGDAPWALGLAGAARMAPYVLLSWAIGSLGDHVRRDRLVLVTLALRCAALLACLLAVVTGHVVLAVVAAGLTVTAATPAYPAVAAALPRLARTDRATEVLVTIEVGGWVVGPALGGLLLVTGAWTLALAVALTALALLLMTGVRLPSPSEPAEDAVAGMLRAVLASPPARAALGVAAALNLLETAAGLLLLPVAVEAWHTGSRGFGAATACLGFGALAAPLVGRLARGSWARPLLAVALLLALVALTPVPAYALPLLAAAGAASVVVESAVTARLQHAVPDRYRAGALGLADTVMVGACLLGTLTAPALAALLGPRPALLAVAVLAAVPAALGRASRRTAAVEPHLAA